MSRTTVILLLLCVFTFVAAAAVAYGVFQAVPHLEDEQANLFAAKVFASGKLYVPSPAQPAAFFVPFVIEWEGRRISKYPPGYSLVLAPGVLAHTPWLVNPLLGALALVAIFALGRSIFPDAQGEQTALIAAILAAISPMFLGLSSALLSHALSLLLLTVFAWACIRSTFQTRRQTLYALVAGIALGAAALARPLTALAYAVPFALWAIWRLVRRQTQLRNWILIACVAGAIAALLPLYQWQVTGDLWVNLYATWWSYDAIGFGPGHGPLPEGHSLVSALHNIHLDLLSLLTDLHGWPNLSWLLFVPGLLLAPRIKREAALVIPLVALAIAHSFYWVRGSGIYGPRYWYEASSFLWLLSARGLVKLWEWGHNQRWTHNCIKVGLALLIALDVAVTVPARFSLWRGLYSVTNEPWHAVQQANLHNALVIVRSKSWTDYGAVLWANTPTLDGDIVFAHELVEGNETIIAQYPSRSVYLLDGTRLTPLK
jgi:4-amino-4-deoxy-L-arabinose transferase-like glycosyltransferase